MVKKAITNSFLSFILLAGMAQVAMSAPSADENNPQHLSLGEVIRLSAGQHYTVQVAKSQWDEQIESTRETRSAMLPQVSMEISQARQRQNYLGSSYSYSSTSSEDEYYGMTFNSFEAQLKVTQVLYNRNLSKAIMMSRQYESSKELSYQAAREAAALQGAEYFLNAIKAKARLDAASFRSKWAQESYSQARLFEEAGKGSILETARASLQYENEFQSLSEASTGYANSLLFLAQWLGYKQDQSFILDTPSYPYLIPSLDTAIREALKNRPDLCAQRKQLEALTTAIDKVRSERWPSLGLSASGGVNGGEPDNADRAYSVGIGLEIPLYTGGDIESRIKQAQAKAYQQKITLQNLETGVEKDIREAYSVLEGARVQQESALKGVKAAETVLKLTQSLYREGLSTNLEVSEAQDTLARAQENLIRAQYTFYLAQTNLAYSLGNLEKSFTSE